MINPLKISFVTFTLNLKQNKHWVNIQELDTSLLVNYGYILAYLHILYTYAANIQ